MVLAMYFSPFCQQIILKHRRNENSLILIASFRSFVFPHLRFDGFVAQIDDYFFPGFENVNVRRDVIFREHPKPESVFSQHHRHWRTAYAEAIDFQARG
jgi:hypothetical protein